MKVRIILIWEIKLPDYPYVGTLNTYLSQSTQRLGEIQRARRGLTRSMAQASACADAEAQADACAS